jgi:hypothetical protein
MVQTAHLGKIYNVQLKNSRYGIISGIKVTLSSKISLVYFIVYFNPKHPAD